MEEAVIKWGAAVAISFFVIKWLFELLKYSMSKKLTGADTQFVDMRDCKNFRQRIGKESECHGERLETQRKSITKIEKGMIYLVQEQGGDPVKMGLME